MAANQWVYNWVFFTPIFVKLEHVITMTISLLITGRGSPCNIHSRYITQQGFTIFCVRNGLPACLRLRGPQSQVHKRKHESQGIQQQNAHFDWYDCSPHFLTAALMNYLLKNPPTQKPCQVSGSVWHRKSLPPFCMNSCSWDLVQHAFICEMSCLEWNSLLHALQLLQIHIVDLLQELGQTI